MARPCRSCHARPGTNRGLCEPCRYQRYGKDHQRRRAAWAPRIATGDVRCARCGHTIAADEPWHLDHLAGDVSHPSHQHCNVVATTQRERPPAARPW